MTVKKVEKKEWDYPIRPLKQKDREILSELVARTATKVKQTKIFDLIKSKKTGDKKEEGNDRAVVVELGVELLDIVLKTLNEDVKEWFADLINVKVEEFSELPFDIEYQIVEQLKEREEISNFFYGFFQRFKEIRKSATQ